MPRKKEKRKDDSSVNKSVPESPLKKAKRSATSPADRPRMTLASEPIKGTLKKISWSGPPPRLPRGPSSSGQRGKLKEKDEVMKQLEKDQEEGEKDQDEGEELEKKSPRSGLPPLPPFKAAGQAGSSLASASQKDASQPVNGSETAKKAPTFNMPNIIEMDIEAYLELQKKRDPYRSPNKKTSPNILRIHTLRALYYFTLNSKDGPKGDLLNLKALLQAYKANRLSWEDDKKVTYWYNGKQLCGPKEYDVEEHRRLAAEQEYPRGLWVFLLICVCGLDC